VRDDEAQYLRPGAFLRTEGRVFVAHVLVEVVWALASTYAYPKARIVAAVEHLLDLDVVALQDAAEVASALQDYRSSQADFSDCLILATLGASTNCPWGRSTPSWAGSRARGSSGLARPAE
jgi:predicted nucleic-acid-binding protein